MSAKAKEILIELLGADTNATDEQLANSAKEFQDRMVAFNDETELKIKNAEAEIETLKNAAGKTNDQKVNELEAKVTELKNRADSTLKDLVEKDLAEFAVVITNKDETREALMTNRASTVKLLQGAKAKVADRRESPLHNRANGNHPEEGATEIEAQKVLANRVSNRVAELRKGDPKLTFPNAWARASKELAVA